MGDLVEAGQVVLDKKRIKLFITLRKVDDIKWKTRKYDTGSQDENAAFCVKQYSTDRKKHCIEKTTF